MKQLTLEANNSGVFCRGSDFGVKRGVCFKDVTDSLCPGERPGHEYIDSPTVLSRNEFNLTKKSCQMG